MSTKEAEAPSARTEVGAWQMLRQVSRRVSNLAEGFRQMNADPVKDVEKGEGKQKAEGSVAGDIHRLPEGDKSGRLRARAERRRQTEGKPRTEFSPENVPLAAAAAAEEAAAAAAAAKREGEGRSASAGAMEDTVERSTGSDSRRGDSTEAPGAAAGTPAAGDGAAGGRMTSAKTVNNGGQEERVPLPAYRTGGFSTGASMYTSWATGVEKKSFLKRCRAWVVDHLMDLFGSEMDFDTAYARAKQQQPQPEELDVHSTTYSETAKDSVRAAEHIYFFPLRFRDASLEREYGEVCGQLFVGRDFLVLVLTLILIIPITWWLASVCFQSVELDAHSHGAWIAFQTACAVDVTIAIASLIVLTIPTLSRWLHSHYEVFSYCLTLQWMSVLLVVLSTFPRLVRAPAQMDVLFNFSADQIVAEVKRMSPLCRTLGGLPGLDPLLSQLQKDTSKPELAIAACLANPQCTVAAVQASAQSVGICAKDLAAAHGTVGTAHALADVWLPFAFYVSFVKQTLQVFKLPLLAIAIIVIHFGTGMMFMDSLSPSRTRFTIFIHIVVVPLCAMPFILLRVTYPSIIPIEES